MLFLRPHPLQPLVQGISIALVVFLGLANAARTRADTASPASGAASLTHRSEAGLQDAINGARATNGVPPLVADAELRDAARSRAQDMVNRNYFSHVTPDGRTLFDLLDSDSIPWTAAGENLAESRGTDPVQAAMDDFMRSPAHRENLLNPRFGHIGAGAAQRDDGTVLVTVVFTN